MSPPSRARTARSAARASSSGCWSPAARLPADGAVPGWPSCPGPPAGHWSLPRGRGGAGHGGPSGGTARRGSAFSNNERKSHHFRLRSRPLLRLRHCHSSQSRSYAVVVREARLSAPLAVLLVFLAVSHCCPAQTDSDALCRDSARRTAHFSGFAVRLIVRSGRRGRTVGEKPPKKVGSLPPAPRGIDTRYRGDDGGRWGGAGGQPFKPGGAVWIRRASSPVLSSHVSRGFLVRPILLVYDRNE